MIVEHKVVIIICLMNKYLYMSFYPAKRSLSFRDSVSERMLIQNSVLVETKLLKQRGSKTGVLEPDGWGREKLRPPSFRLKNGRYGPPCRGGQID